MDRAGLTITLFGPTVDIRCRLAPPGAPLSENPRRNDREGSPVKARSKKGLWLLALLALQANRPLSREWIAGALWPESETARETLRRTLTDVRSALGPSADRLDATGQTL
jgi:DNA-binding winged helix-turn-helix (wHTH) protein